MITGDRSAVKLSGDLLVDNGTKPNVLNTTCTEEFFDADGDPPACGGSDDAQDLNSALGVNGNTKVNVTIEDNGTIVNTGTQLSAGPSPTSTASVTVSQRIVLLDGEEETLFVRVW